MKLSRLCRGAMVVAAVGLTAGVALAIDGWLTEAEVRKEIVGKNLAGHYASGLKWSETYGADGRLDYKEPSRHAVGDWSFTGDVFCTFYDAGMSGGCWHVKKTGRNCYEFYSASRSKRPDTIEAERKQQTWTARGWRTEEPSSCELPTV